MKEEKGSREGVRFGGEKRCFFGREGNTSHMTSPTEKKDRNTTSRGEQRSPVIADVFPPESASLSQPEGNEECQKKGNLPKGGKKLSSFTEDRSSFSREGGRSSAGGKGERTLSSLQHKQGGETSPPRKGQKEASNQDKMLSE